MKNIILKSIRNKIVNRIKQKIKLSKEKNFEDSFYLFKPDSSVLLAGTHFDFRQEIHKRLYVEIGQRCLIRAEFTFESNSGYVRIGNNVNLGGVHFLCKTLIEIEDDVMMAWGITIYDHNSHSIYWDERKTDLLKCYTEYFENNGNNGIGKDWGTVITKPVKIQSKVWVGFNVIILKGVTIGEGAVIGAGSVVASDIPAWTVAVGNPARVIKFLNK